MIKKYFDNLSIGAKIVAISATLSVVFLGSSFAYILGVSRNDLISLNVDLLEYELSSEDDVIRVTTKDIEKSLLAISETPPFQGIIRANKNNGYDVEGGSSYEQWKQRLETIFISQMKSTNNYMQLRYIDENGKEMVRVDEVGSEFLPVSEENLQDKSDRDYFKSSINLGYQNIYVSKTELNREGNPPVISQPYIGVTRYSTPVIDETTNETKGILIANVKFDSIIKDNDFTAYDNAETYVVNQEGFYMLHDDFSKRWGGPSDLNTGENIFLDYPMLKEVVADSVRGSKILEDNIFAYSWVDLGNIYKSEKWLIVVRMPSNLIFESINKATLLTIMFGLSTLIVLFFVYLFSIKKLLRPLKDLTEGAEIVGKGIFDKKLNTTSKDEIGKVAIAFNKMTERLRGLYSTLDKRVKKRTQELNNEKNKMETILESIGDGVFVIDKNRNIILFNHTSSNLTGYRKEEVLNKKYNDVLKFVDAESKTENYEFIENVFKEGKVCSMPQNTNLIMKNGAEISVADSAAPLKDKKGKLIGVVVVFRDVSVERQIDKAKTEFVSLASHQLRTPLTAIKWDTEMLYESTKHLLNPDQIELINDVLFSNQRMIDLVNSLLNVSRIDLGNFSINPEECDIEEIAEGVLSDIRKQIVDKSIKISKNYSDKLVRINADKNLLRIIIQNLLTNAVKYTKVGGHVWIDLSMENNKYIIRVRDNGIGIPERQKYKIFKKLFRADNVISLDTDGNGLGLYLVKSIIEQIGGKISFESIENEGTTFVVELPKTGMKRRDGTRKLD